MNDVERIKKDMLAFEKMRKDVSDLGREIRIMGMIALDQDRIREDYYGLHSDIISELQRKCMEQIGRFYEFVEVARETRGLVTTQMAYEAGKKAAEQGVAFEDAINRFQDDVLRITEQGELAARRDLLFMEVCTALGDADALMRELVELSGKMDIEQYHIHRFFELGYNSPKTIAG